MRRRAGAPRAAAAAEDALPEKADRRFEPAALAAISRVFAREAALKVAEEGVRWVAGRPTRRRRSSWPPPAAGARTRGQAGLLADMDAVADALYGRSHLGPKDCHERATDPPRSPSSASRAILPDAPDAADVLDQHPAGRYASATCRRSAGTRSSTTTRTRTRPTRPTAGSAAGCASFAWEPRALAQTWPPPYRWSGLRAAQTGLLADMTAVADALYGREAVVMTITMEPIAIVGVGAIMPDAPDAATFWDNIKSGRYRISDVPPDRWDPELYYDPDPHAPDKTYSKIGGWVRDYAWDPLAWQLPIPPKVSGADGRRPEVGGGLHPRGAARLRLAGADRRPRAHRGDPRQRDRRREALPDGAADPVPRVRPRPGERRASPRCPPTCATAITRARLARAVPRPASPEITEDTMPGELANCIAGRVANLFNFRGPNFTTDAACASGAGRDVGRGARACGRRLRRRRHRRRRPQHGRRRRS